MNVNKVKTASIKLLSPVFSEILENESQVKLNITGNSMYPLFRSGVDKVVLKKKPGIFRCDIVFYQRKNGDFVLHRVVGERDGAFCMAGDFETEIEHPVYRDQIIASVDSFYRNGKHFSCGNLIYRCYSRLWIMVIPQRYKIISVLKKMRRAVYRLQTLRSQGEK